MNPAISQLLREHFKVLQGYVSAGMEIRKQPELVFLNANENPYELQGLEGYNVYPEPQPQSLLTALAETYDVPPQWLILTRGADEAIAILTRLFCEPHRDSILQCPPTFGMYRVNANTMPVAGVVDVPLIEQGAHFLFDAAAVEAAVTAPAAHIKLVYICSPNNPTGTAIPHATVQDLCRRLEGKAIVVLDETYAEFSAQGSLSPALTDHPNLVILRTLSKSYAMAGVRVGCFLSADTGFCDLVRSKALDAYPIPRPCIDAALLGLKPEQRQRARTHISWLVAERERVRARLEGHPGVITVFDSDANFLLVKLHRARAFCEFAALHQIILRDFSDKPMTQNCLRWSMGTAQQNDRVLELLDRFSSLQSADQGSEPLA